MKRLTYIYWAAPLTLALNSVPGLLGRGSYALLAAGILAVALWGVVWMRLYTNRKLRPEFAVLSILPSGIAYAMAAMGSETQELIQSPTWQNLYFILWLSTIFVYLRTLIPGPKEEQRPLRNDPVLLFIGILSTLYLLSCWVSFNNMLFPTLH